MYDLVASSDEVADCNQLNTPPHHPSLCKRVGEPTVVFRSAFEISTHQVPNAGRFSIWRLRLSAKVVGKCLSENSPVIKNYAKSLCRVLVSFMGALLLSPAVCVGV